MALDPEAAEHHAERQVHPLEHRALLDVQLEVGGRPASRAASPARSRSTPWAASASGSATPSRSVRPRTASGSSVPARCARAEQAAAEPRALLVGPVDELDGDGPVPAPARARPRARPARPACRRANRRRAPSRGGCRRSRSARSRPGSVAHVLPAGPARPRRRGSRRAGARSQSRAAIHVSVHATRWAPRSSEVRRASSRSP